MTGHFRFSVTALWLLAAFSLRGSAQEPRAVLNRADGLGLNVAYHGGLVTPPLPKPEFTLTDTSGAPFDFRAKTDGRVTLLFFGYTHCASICPTQMSYLAGAMKRLPKNVTERFKVVFVTTDPAHDTPASLRTWLNHFDRSFVGLTGSGAQVKAAQVAARIPWSESPVEHAAFVLAYTTDNLGHLIYPAGITQKDWIEDLPRLAREDWITRPVAVSSGR